MLTEHFNETELSVLGCEAGIVENARFLCEKILEPLRKHFDEEVLISSGYRDSSHNARVGGKLNSYHLYTEGHAAADIKVHNVLPFFVFEWLRLESKLPFDKVIMEKKNGVPVIIHIQVDRYKEPKRQALVGDTGDCKVYQEVTVA